MQKAADFKIGWNKREERVGSKIGGGFPGRGKEDISTGKGGGGGGGSEGGQPVLKGKGKKMAVSGRKKRVSFEEKRSGASFWKWVVG